MSDVTFHQVADPQDAAIVDFGELQRAAYFASETLIPARFIPQLLQGQTQTDSRCNYLVVAEHDQRVVGAASSAVIAAGVTSR